MVLDHGMIDDLHDNLACFQAGQITKKGRGQPTVDIYNFGDFVVTQTMDVNLKAIYLLIFQL